MTENKRNKRGRMRGEINLKIEAMCSYEIMVHIYQSTWRVIFQFISEFIPGGYRD
jgi:hypothetical protein